MNYNETKEEIKAEIELLSSGKGEDICLNYTHPAIILDAIKELNLTVSTCRRDPDDMVINRYFIDHNIRFYIFSNKEYLRMFVETNLLDGTTYIRFDYDN